MLYWSIIRTITEAEKMTQMYNPPHPGEVLKDTVLAADGGGQTVTAFAKRLGVSRVALSNIVNGHAAITADMAVRLEQALGISAETWLRVQGAYDLWQVRKSKRRPKIEPLRLAV
jgi:addiction module HigA family antidote